MNIQNINIAQGLFCSNEDKSSPRKENISALRINLPDAQDKAGVENSKVLSDENVTLVIYPPFFPVGNTQDILSIERVNLTGEGVRQSASSVNVEEQKAIRQQQIDKKTTNADARAVRLNMAKSPDVPMRSNMMQVKQEAKPGVVLDLKV